MTWVAGEGSSQGSAPCTNNGIGSGSSDEVPRHDVQSVSCVAVVAHGGDLRRGGRSRVTRRTSYRTIPGDFTSIKLEESRFKSHKVAKVGEEFCPFLA